MNISETGMLLQAESFLRSIAWSVFLIYFL